MKKSASNKQKKKKKKLDRNNPVLLPCDYCDEKYSFHELRKHKKTAHLNVPCDICNQIFENPVVLNKHKYAKHVKLLKLKVKKECVVCRKMITAHVMNRHMQGMPF